MDTNFLNLYLDSNVKLVKTMCIKSHTSALIVNDYILKTYGISADSNDLTTWKYYQNISGQYHSADKPMKVFSLDNQEEIVFTIDNLKDNPATADAYAYGTRYYYSLINKYPDQEQLIMGILYPANINDAISRPEGSILAYDKILVESQEASLIYELEQYIYNYLVRWNVSSFAVSDNLYNAAQLAIMYLNIVSKLLNLRLARCKTNEAHSFHIKQYLASHDGLDAYIPYLTLKQTLYFYRNILYIERNSGKVSQLATLIDKILTDRNIPLSELSIRLLNNNFNDKYSPIVNVKRKPINNTNSAVEKEYLDLTKLFNIESPLVIGNDRYMTSKENYVTHQLSNSKSNIIQTKDLQSAMIDYSNAVPDTLEDVLIRQWVSLSQNNKYNTIANFKNPKDSSTISLSSQDCLIYYYYILLSVIGVTDNNIPGYFNHKERLFTIPNNSVLLEHVSSKNYIEMLTIVNNLRLLQPVISSCNTSESFFNLSYSIYEEAKRQWYLISNTHDLVKRAEVENIINKLYKDNKYYPLVSINNTNNTFSTWLNNVNLPEYNFTNQEAITILLNIINSVTGYTVDKTKLLANIQKAMISLISKLSSYSIQFSREINQSDIVPVNWAAIRVGNFNTSLSYSCFVKETIKVLDINASLNHTFNISNINTELLKEVVTYNEPITYNIDIDVNTVIDYIDSRLYKVYFSSPVVNMSYLYDGNYINSDSKFIGIEYYQSLTTDQLKSLKFIF